MPPTQARTLAPGARVVIRDEEWSVRSVRSASWGGQAVHVTGVSELVLGKDAVFLTEIDEVAELRPEETALVHDPSPTYRRSRLYLESLLRRTPPTDAAIHLGHRAAIRPADYQLQPAAKALAQPRPRVLLADGVGLGKTIEAGVLLAELIQRGRGDRILVVALKSMLEQLQQELWARFTIPLVRLDSAGVERVKTRIPSGMNPFHYFDRVIVSIDTLKDGEYRRDLEASRWDVVLIDECQNVAVRTTGGSSQMALRARLARLLARTSDALILTSATPHDGRPESFASLIHLLEPTAIADPGHYTSDEVRDYFLRRFKKDVAHEVAASFQERRLDVRRVDASPAEDAAFAALAGIEFRTIAREQGGKGVLFRTLLLKAFLSSPAACAATIRARLDKDAVKDRDDPGARHDRAVLEALLAKVAAVKTGDFRKYQALLAYLGELGIGRKGSGERVVVFTERIDTLELLAAELRQDLRLGEGDLALFHGTLDDERQQALVRSFGNEASPIRVLLASDAASEGLNLHYHCHRLVHFDLPWSFITLEQRNGRIDRFGQEHEPRLTYLLSIPGDRELQGDLRVLERLIDKEDAAHRNLGDVAWLLDLHSSEREEEHIARGIEEHRPADQVVPDEPAHTDFLALLEGAAEPVPERREPVRLFPDDLAYLRDAFQEVLGGDSDQLEWHDHLQGLTLIAPEDLGRRFDYLPPELRTGGDRLKLTVDRQRVMDALEQARKEEGRWPEWQLLWDLHPVAGWLGDRVLAVFARHEAPVLRVRDGLGHDDRVFLFQGVVSNHRSQPVLADWFGVRFARGAAHEVIPLADLVRETGLDRGTTNPGGGLSSQLLDRLGALREPAVVRAKEHMKALRHERAAALGASLRTGLGKLTAWKDRSLGAIEARRKSILARRRLLRRDEEARLRDAREEVEKRFAEREAWIEQGMRTVQEPYLRLVAVLVPREVA